MEKSEVNATWIWLLGRIEVTTLCCASEPKKTKDVTHDWDLAGLVSKGLFQRAHVPNFMTPRNIKKSVLPALQNSRRNTPWSLRASKNGTSSARCCAPSSSPSLTKKPFPQWICSEPFSQPNFDEIAGSKETRGGDYVAALLSKHLLLHLMPSARGL